MKKTMMYYSLHAAGNLRYEEVPVPANAAYFNRETVAAEIEKTAEPDQLYRVG